MTDGRGREGRCIGECVRYVVYSARVGMRAVESGRGGTSTARQEQEQERRRGVGTRIGDRRFLAGGYVQWGADARVVNGRRARGGGPVVASGARPTSRGRDTRTWSARAKFDSHRPPTPKGSVEAPRASPDQACAPRVARPECVSASVRPAAPTVRRPSAISRRRGRARACRPLPIAGAWQPRLRARGGQITLTLWRCARRMPSRTAVRRWRRGRCGAARR